MEEQLQNNLSQTLAEAVADVSDLQAAYRRVKQALVVAGYSVAETNIEKPWGAFVKVASREADRFVGDFPFGVSPGEARLGTTGAELSLKVLAVAPGQRLSWQYHKRRAERWVFLTDGAFRKSNDNKENDILYAKAGDVVQLSKGERHRIEGLDDKIVLVAEIWQHADPSHLSDENDVVRLSDDYQR